MAERTIKLRRLQQIARNFGIDCSEGRGKGSHCMFSKVIDGHPVSFPMPTDKEVLICYLRPFRKRFKLTVEDDVSDNDFYNS